MPGEAPAGGVLVVQQREDGRVGVQVGDGGERALGAAHDQQVVVREADASGERRGGGLVAVAWAAERGGRVRGSGVA